jgi:peptidyl-tRNA hydrolase
MSTTSTGSTRFVQPIMLQRSGSHEDAVTAAALASVLAYTATAEDPSWEPWIGGRFAKSVRRAKPNQFAAIAPRAVRVVEIGEAKAAAFLPSTYSDLDPALAKLQVSGTEFDRSGTWPSAPEEGGPWLLVNGSLEMSTGKTAAQVAHGLFAWYLSVNTDRRAQWLAEQAPATVSVVTGPEFATSAQNAVVTINDAGFTEIAPGSATVVVL